MFVFWLTVNVGQVHSKDIRQKMKHNNLTYLRNNEKKNIYVPDNICSEWSVIPSKFLPTVASAWVQQARYQ